MSKENLFKEWYDCVPWGEAKRIRAEIILRCKITAPVFSNWIHGKTKIHELAKPILNEIAKRETNKTIFDECE